MPRLNGTEDRIARLVLATARLCRGEAVTVRWFIERFKVSLATAKRDADTLEAVLPCSVERIQDGAPGGVRPRRLRLAA